MDNYFWLIKHGCTIRIEPKNNKGLIEVRIWHGGNLVYGSDFQSVEGLNWIWEHVRHSVEFLSGDKNESDSNV